MCTCMSYLYYNTFSKTIKLTIKVSTVYFLMKQGKREFVQPDIDLFAQELIYGLQENVKLYGGLGV